MLIKLRLENDSRIWVNNNRVLSVEPIPDSGHLTLLHMNDNTHLKIKGSPKDIVKKFNVGAKKMKT